MTTARLALANLARTPLRTAIRIGVLAIASALLGAMLLFIGTSLRSMTESATRSVPLDWQGPLASYPDATRIAAAVDRQPGILQASATATAPIAGAVHSGAGGATSAGASSLLAVPPDYLAHIHSFRFLQGGLRPGQVVLDQQLAATLRAQIGETVSLSVRKGAKPQPFKVSGIALVSAPDVLFQPLDPQLGPAPAQPPANVAVMPVGTFARTLAPSLSAVSAANIGSNAVPGAQTGVQWQVQAQVDPAALGGSPSTALKRADRIRNRVERSLPGKIRFVDNLSEGLTGASQDALYAEALYIMLAVPGALIAFGLAYLAALSTVDRDRRELALLRARGATRRALLAMAAQESVVVGFLAGLIGAGIALAAVDTLVKGGVQLSPGRAIATGLTCVLGAIAGALVARLGASARVIRASVAESRRSVRREGKPLWQRLYLDWVALAVSGLIYWLTARTGFSAVINPDANPTLSLSVYMFFAPALLWIGSALLLVRLRGRFVAWISRRGAGERASTMRELLLASAGRRGAAINRGILAVGLLLAFGVNLSIFTATYDRQASVDAQLTLGADVVATAPPGVTSGRNLAARIAAVPGVAATSPVDHSYAYVGPDLQDTYGIDAATLTRATTLRDSYFVGAGARQTLDRLRATPDGIVVSKETITDYSLAQGDLLKLRLLDRRSGSFRVVSFHVVGTVQEFPSAPKDSFMVANLPYLQQASHDLGPNVVFARASGDPSVVARRVAAATKADGAVVKDIRQQTPETVSSITTVDLSGVSKIEEAFAILLAATAMGLFVALNVSERRHEFATMAAVGASLREIAGFLWSEAALVLAAGAVLAAGIGWLLSEMLVAMLSHVFDPPPDALAIPWTYLLELGGAALVGAALAAALAIRGLSRLPLGGILREQ
ncbi:MAG: putative transport system permease protein [Solirubrobacterales bacterium]|jgi:putative ABC transport system permease protein|nr:putative transport system permease protein [Solirubrobacterales bacterium]